MRVRAVAVLIVAATWGGLDSASAQTLRPITFEEARLAAGQDGPAVVLAARRVGLAQAQIDVAGALTNPTVTLTTARQTARLGASVAVPVPVFGQRSRAVAAAEAEAYSARLDVAAAAVEARFLATVAWIDLWEAQERARLLHQAAADAARVAGIAQEKFSAGAGPEVDVLRTRADRVRAEAEASGADATILAAAARLATSIGGPEAVGLRASGGPGFSAMPVNVQALTDSIHRTPLLRRDAADVTAAAARVQVEQRLRWPIVSFLLTVDQGDPTLPATDVIGGVSFDLPVLNLRGGAIARARAEQSVAQATLELDAARIRHDTADAAARAEAAGGRAAALAAQVLPALEAARQMTEEGYRDGRVDLLRLIEAQRAVLEARLANAEAQAAWQRAIGEVERAAGTHGETADAP